MGKKRKYKKRKSGSLSQGTIFTLFALASIASSGVMFYSFFADGGIFLELRSVLSLYFGPFSWVAPINALLIGLLLTRINIFLTRANVIIGTLLLSGSILGLFRSGIVGIMLFSSLEGALGAVLSAISFVFLGLIGIIFLINIEFADLVSFIGMVFSGSFHIMQQSIVALFKTKKNSFAKQMQPIQIKGLDEKDNGRGPVIKQAQLPHVASPITSTTAVKKDSKQPDMADELVLNKPLEIGMWEYPPISLLSDTVSKKADKGDVKKVASTIENTLGSFRIQARVAEINVGPSVTQYALSIAQGTKLTKITSLANDLALATEAPTGQIRIEAPIPGRSLVGIEIPNRSREIVSLKRMIESAAMQKAKSKLAVPLGLDVSGNPIIADITKMPHVLIAGTTGSGKSILVNTFIASLLFRASPSEVKMILIDPKRVEMTGYRDIPHLLCPVVVEPEQSVSALKWAMKEMDRRYVKFAEAGVRNIDAYNELAGFQALPYIVIFIDELADLMALAAVEVEDSIARLAQMARATGIHLVLATQRPSVDVLTGLIKANIPARIAFNVSSGVDSKVIIDSPGAEKLLGRGDMLYIPPDQTKPTRIQGTFVSDQDVKRLVNFIKSRGVPVQYTTEVIEQQVNLKGRGAGGVGGGDEKDELFSQAVRVVCQYDRASSSLLQRRLEIGFNRAARILEQLEAAGVVGAADGSKPREVLVKNPDEFLSQYESS